MNRVSLLINKNVLIAACIGAVLGLVAGGKSGGNLWWSVVFGLVVGIVVGYLGNSYSSAQTPPNQEKDDSPHD